ncbi:hypothetical protein HMPREF9124_0426 [Oribacterium sp. oral taxon 108 str. F0425]|nr:hypothetical protein HMPREF9124_0426 [Oribacterium sp. oral taxon 108 str. F0425]
MKPVFSLPFFFFLLSLKFFNKKELSKTSFTQIVMKCSS